MAFVLGLYGDDGKIVKNDLGGESFCFASDFFFLAWRGEGRLRRTYVTYYLGSMGGMGKGFFFFMRWNFFFLAWRGEGRLGRTYVTYYLGSMGGMGFIIKV